MGRTASVAMLAQAILAQAQHLAWVFGLVYLPFGHQAAVLSRCCPSAARYAYAGLSVRLVRRQGPSDESSYVLRQLVEVQPQARYAAQCRCKMDVARHRRLWLEVQPIQCTPLPALWSCLRLGQSFGGFERCPTGWQRQRRQLVEATEDSKLAQPQHNGQSTVARSQHLCPFGAGGRD